MNDEPEAPTYPEGVGPHEGRELELMLAGKKPLAMFYEGITIPVSEVYPEEDFMPHVEAGTLIRRDEIYKHHDHPIPAHYVYYVRPGEEWRVDRMHEIKVALLAGTLKWTNEYEREVGRLLGYADKDIEIFIKWLNSKRPLK